MQLASIKFDGEKKNSKKFIIPASYFIKKGITPITVKKPETKSQNIEKPIVEQELIQINEESEEYNLPESTG